MMDIKRLREIWWRWRCWCWCWLNAAAIETHKLVKLALLASISSVCLGVVVGTWLGNWDIIQYKHELRFGEHSIDSLLLLLSNYYGVFF